MNPLARYNDIIKGTNLLALATCADGPGVRIMNYCCETDHPGVLYVSTDRTNQKVTAFSQNPAVAITTIPTAENDNHFIRASGTVKKCPSTIWEMEDIFLAQNPDMTDALAHIGDALDVYEIHFTSATIEGGFGEPEQVVF